MSLRPVFGFAFVVLLLSACGGGEEANSATSGDPTMPEATRESDFSLEQGFGIHIVTDDPEEIIRLWALNHEYAVEHHRTDILELSYISEEEIAVRDKESENLFLLRGTYGIDQIGSYSFTMSLAEDEDAVIAFDPEGGTLVAKVSGEVGTYDVDGSPRTYGGDSIAEFTKVNITTDDGGLKRVWKLVEIDSDRLGTASGD